MFAWDPPFRTKTGMVIPNPLNRYRKRCHFCKCIKMDSFLFTKFSGAFTSFICVQCFVNMEYDYAQWLQEKIRHYEDIEEKL